MRKILGRIAALAAMLTMTGLVTPAASAAEPYCGITWGSLDKGVQRAFTDATINDVRAGRNDCYDRLVIDMSGGPAPDWYHVGYVDVVTDQIRGTPIPLAGDAFLNVDVGSSTYDGTFHPTYRPADRMRVVNVAGFETFRQVALVNTHAGLTQFGMGVRDRLPFRVFTITGPGTTARLVIDVAHRW